MGMTTKFVKIKLCKTCKENLNYKKFREVKRLTKGTNKGKFAGWTDRIDPKKGYVKGNIIVVSMRANRIKTDATVDEIRKVADFYEKLLKNK